jgi:Ca2+-binding RTX toxin-like protein
VENLTLTGNAAINGTGNSIANVLVGNAAANQLSGAGGNDTYAGGLGADVLTDTSTTSADTYQWGRDQGQDVVTDSGGNDRLQVLAGVTADQLWLQHLGNDLDVKVIGTGDDILIKNWYGSTSNRIETFVLSDGKTLLAADVQKLVNAMASFSPPADGQTTLPTNYQGSLLPVIASNWH